MTTLDQLINWNEDDISDEEMQEMEYAHWNGPGGIKFYVIQNVPDIFEIEVLDYWGCAGGLQETLGIEYSLEDGILGIERDQLKEGVTYTINDLTVIWTRGDGWEIDDDVDYYFDTLTAEWNLISRIRQKLYNWWWRSIGYRIDNWKVRRKEAKRNVGGS